jgi:hypothetical protein
MQVGAPITPLAHHRPLTILLMSRLPRALAIVAAVILVLSSGAHSLLGWPALQTRMATGNVPADLIGGLAMGWHFAGLSMLVLGLLAADRRGTTNVALPLQLIGGAYELFAIGCFAMLGWDPFLLTFFVPGTLLSIAGALMRRPEMIASEAQR